MKTHRENAYCMRFMQISSYEEKTHICGLCGPFKIQIHYADWENICADVLIQAVFFNWLISETHKRKSAWNPMWNPHDELYCKPCHKTSFYFQNWIWINTIKSYPHFALHSAHCAFKWPCSHSAGNYKFQSKVSACFLALECTGRPDPAMGH